MKNENPVVPPRVSSRQFFSSKRRVASNMLVYRQRLAKAATKVSIFALVAILVLQSLAFSPAVSALTTKANTLKSRVTRPLQEQVGSTVLPTPQPITVFPSVNVGRTAQQEALAPSTDIPSEIRAIDAPKGEPPSHDAMPISLATEESPALSSIGDADAPAAAANGPSPGTSKSFKGEFLSSTSIPPDTHGAVGTTHIVTVSNDRMRIQTRDGVEISRVTLSSFWSGVTLKGGAAVSAFDPKVLYDRFNNRFILISSANAQLPSSAALFAVSQTSDPTGNWYRYSADADPNATSASGRWIDYPTIGQDKDKIVVMENVFNYGTAGTGYYGPYIYVLDKQTAYAGTLSNISLFQDSAANCTGNNQGAILGCGFTMAPSIVEDNTTTTNYLVEDWNSTAGQLRLSKITGTGTAPILTLGTQFPQSPLSWRFNALRILTNSTTSSGGYAPQRQQSANLPSGTRLMNNDSRIQNAVLRNGTLWCAHTVMLSTAPQPAGTAVGGSTNAANPDNHAGIQWWQIDPTIETGQSTPPLQRGRIEDPTADNCHNGTGGTRTIGTCTSTAQQVGQFYAFPNISVNQNNDMLLGFTQFSALTYPSAAYALRLNSDPANTTRDPAISRPGQANYNLGSGSGTTRQNRWGDYSEAQTDPLNDTDFWTVQEYSGTVRDFGIGLAGNWETWWAKISPSSTQPSKTNGLIISEFRLRGPQGARDEFVELYNPNNTPVIVNTTDNSDGWALAFSSNGTTLTSAFAVIPNGTVIPAFGHFLVVDNPDSANGPTVTYSLNGYPSAQIRGADSDTGWSLDLADNGGIALFRTSNTVNFAATTRMDSVGFSNIAAGLYKEGTGLPAMTSQPTTNFSFYRKAAGIGSGGLSGRTYTGLPQDTDDNANDFFFVDVAGTDAGSGQRLGAPGPENLSSPIIRNSSIQTNLLDRTKSETASPNRVRDMTAVTNGALGTLDVRKRFVNNTGSSVTSLRFRVVNITTFPAPAGVADLRALTSAQLTGIVVNDSLTCSASGAGTAPCSVAVQGLTLEEPPVQALSGGFNSTLSAGTITLAQPLAAGASINLRFLYGVQQSGSFTVALNVEAIP